MSWVLIYIATNFLAPIPLISLGIDDFSSHFPPKSKNFVTRISQKSPNRLKPDLRPAKAGPPANASLASASLSHPAPSLHLRPCSARPAPRRRCPAPTCAPCPGPAHPHHASPSSAPRSQPHRFLSAVLFPACPHAPARHPPSPQPRATCSPHLRLIAQSPAPRFDLLHRTSPPGLAPPSSWSSTPSHRRPPACSHENQTPAHPT
jgi:hypothetical protein